MLPSYWPVHFSKLKADNTSYYYPIKLTPQDASNVFIDSVWFTSVIRKEFGQNEINIRIYNGTDSDQTNIEVSINIDQTRKTIFFIIFTTSKSYLCRHHSKSFRNAELSLPIFR